MIKRYLVRLLRWLLRSERRDYIREPRIRIMFNPFGHGYRSCQINRYQWSRLNPRTHLWEWKRLPTLSELMAWNSQPMNTHVVGILHREDFDIEPKEQPMPCEEPYRCQFCGEESPCNLWNQDVCPKCGKVYDPMLAQEGDD